MCFFMSTKNVFYYSHLNQAHTKAIEDTWRHTCVKCLYKFPTKEAMFAHSSICVEGANLNQNISTGVSTASATQDHIIFVSEDNNVEPFIELKEEVLQDDNEELITGDI